MRHRRPACRLPAAALLRAEEQPPALSDEADPLYAPLGDLGPWSAAAVDEAGWAGAMRGLGDLRRGEPAWTDMVGRGARLAAAHRSGAMDGAHGDDPDVGSALVRGVATLADVGDGARPHVRANAQALDLAEEAAAVSEDLVRRLHEVACRPQLAHPVRVGDRVQDHVLAHGEYKHHPNHIPVTGGGWRARAPVARVGAEMDHLVEVLASPGFDRLHPVVQAAYALHALTHIAPFADGNGRVARVLAGAFLLRSGGVPLLVPAGRAPDHDGARRAAGAGDPAPLVDFVLRRSVDLVDLIGRAHASPTDDGAAALGRWRRQVQAAQALDAQLLPAARDALARHRARPDLGWLSPLKDADVVPAGPSSHGERFDAGPLVIRAPVPGGPVVEELLAVDAHPLEGEGVVLRAEEARVRLEAGLDEPPPTLAGRLHPWLDRVVSTLALRVAAETE